MICTVFSMALDYDTWNPAIDPRLPYHFSVDALEDRWRNRRALQEYANLPQRDDIPLLAFVSRLDWQKGLDITGPGHSHVNEWLCR